ncbi:MAG: hypothetical protein ACYC6S_03370 [Desulfobulbia bacterium]
MLLRIVIGIIIGFVWGFDARSEKSCLDCLNVMGTFLVVVTLAFIISSFMFGAIFGIMSIGEIGLGYLIVKIIWKKK